LIDSWGILLLSLDYEFEGTFSSVPELNALKLRPGKSNLHFKSYRHVLCRGRGIREGGGGRTTKCYLNRKKTRVNIKQMIFKQ